MNNLTPNSNTENEIATTDRPTIYALLVGINSYLGGVNSLNGCINDIKRVHEYLETRTQTAGLSGPDGSQSPRFNYRPLVLTAGDLGNPKEVKPTRQAIIDGFHHHLSQAREGDVALFYYSGHGSHETTPPEFRHLEPDGMNETLVCYDSRSESGWDLADKEIAVLIAEVAKQKPHIVLIVDSCHSGSITRDADLSGIRWTQRADRPRHLADYEGWQSIAAMKAVGTNDPDNKSWLTLPEGRHMVISACRAQELAAERMMAGSTEVHGVLTYTLLDVLKGNTSGGLTYRDIAMALKSRVNNEVAAQHPQIEADTQSQAMLFLGGAILPQPPYVDVVYKEARGWIIQAGAVHGIQEPMGEVATTLDVFLPGTDISAPSRQPIGTAQVQKVEAGLSTIKLSLNDPTQLDTKRTFRAIVTGQPEPVFTVTLDGDEAHKEALRAAIKKSLLVRALSAEELQVGADFVVDMRKERWHIKRFLDSSPLIVPIEPNKLDIRVLIVMKYLEHMARWLRLARMGNKNSSIPSNAIKMELFESDEHGNLGRELSLASDIRLKQTKVEGEWQPAWFKWKMTNTSNRKLHCTLLDLADDFSVGAQGLLPEDGRWLQPGDSIWVFEYKRPAIPIEMPKEAQQLELTAYRDTLKLIVCTEEFDATGLNQNPLPLSTINTKGVGDAVVRLPKSDWATAQFTIITECPRDSVAIPPAGTHSAALLGSVVVQGHSALSGATLEVSTQRSDARSVSDTLVPPTYRNASGWQSLSVNSTRGEAALDTLCLRNVSDRSVVTVENPFRFSVQQSLQPNQTALVTAYDPELDLYLPLGFGEAAPDGSAIKFTVTHLPAPTSDGTRSPLTSIKMALQVVVSDKLGWGSNPNRLRMVQFDAKGEPSYIDDTVAIKQAVAAASKIWLYVHGFTGDTDGMVRSALHMPQHDAATVVLAFDYENIVSTIETTAANLNEKLRAVDLGPTSNKHPTIVAHSLGTVVTRWLIEQTAGGSEMVKHAILVGGPQLGTPWAGIAQKLFSLVAAIAVNGITATVAPPAWLANMLATVGGGAFGKVALKTLGEITPKSTFFATLNGLSVNAVDKDKQYTVIAGDASKMVYPPDKAQVLQKLMAKLGPTAAGFVLGEPNDLVIAVESIRGIPADRANPDTANLPVVPCDHVSYFATQASLDALAKVL